MELLNSLLSSKNHDVEDFRVRMSCDGWRWLAPSHRIRNAESGQQTRKVYAFTAGQFCRYCWPNDCGCF